MVDAAGSGEYVDEADDTVLVMSLCDTINLIIRRRLCADDFGTMVASTTLLGRGASRPIGDLSVAAA